MRPARSDAGREGSAATRASAKAALAVLVIQSDLLNETGHPSTWILPCTTRLSGQNLLRIPIPKGMAGNREDCEIMIDRSRAIDNRRFIRMLKPLPRNILHETEDRLRRLAEL